jgi:hypothetical protein
LHGKVEPGLSSEGGKHGIGALHGDTCVTEVTPAARYRQVGDILVGHDGGGIGIDQHHLDPLFLQGAAGLCARIVNSAACPMTMGRSQAPALFDLRIFRHFGHLPHGNKAVKQISCVQGRVLPRMKLNGEDVALSIAQALTVPSLMLTWLTSATAGSTVSPLPRTRGFAM